MNARELTTKMFEHDNIIFDYQKTHRNSGTRNCKTASSYGRYAN